MNISDLKRLAGIGTESNEPSMGENISQTATALKKKERKLGLKPGDPDWFKLWFSRPYMTGPVQFRGRKK